MPQCQYTLKEGEEPLTREEFLDLALRWKDIRPAVDRGLRGYRGAPHPARCHGGRHRPAARGEGQILRPPVGRMH